MKKPFVLFASAILISASFPSANATALQRAGSESQVEVVVPVKEVNSNLIQQLELNENQYIQLKASYVKYQQDLAQLKGTAYTKQQIEGLINSYLAEAAKVLKPEQLAAYVGAPKSETLLAEKK